MIKVEGELTNLFIISKEDRHSCIISTRLFNSYGEWIRRKTLDDWLERITRNVINICNLRYADGTSLNRNNNNWTESKYTIQDKMDPAKKGRSMEKQLSFF